LAELYDPLPILGCLGDLGWKWVNIGAQGVGVWLKTQAEGCRIAVIARHRTKSRVIGESKPHNGILANISHCGWLKTTISCQ
jgi:hypothetical protein